MYTKNRLCAILVVLCLTFLLVSCTGPRQKAELIGVVVTQGATGVFNYAPIKATFSAEPEGVSVRTTPRVSGTTLFRGNRVIFVPGERYQPNTEYTVTFTWTEGEARVAFLSANEITEHYQTHFNEYQKGEAPHDWWPIEQGDEASFEVVWLDWASWNHALAGTDSGKEHVHLVMPSFTVSNRNNDILFESTIRREDSIHIGAYLWNDLAQSPLYVGEERIVTQSSTGRFLTFTTTLVFHLAEGTMDVYIDHVLIKEGEAFENLPPAGQLDYAISLYFHGAGHSGDVYWESVRVAEIKR